jgi:hypothetical protein
MAFKYALLESFFAPFAAVLRALRGSKLFTAKTAKRREVREESHWEWIVNLRLYLNSLCGLDPVR